MNKELLRSVVFHLVGWYIVLALLLLLEAICLYVFLGPIHLTWLIVLIPLQGRLWHYVLGATLTKKQLALVKSINQNREIQKENG
jgi:hypothetical protein